MNPQDFTRAFAAAFGARDADCLAGYLSEDSRVLTLTGIWAEGPTAAKHVFASEFSGLFARARLVTGKSQLRPLADGITLVHQRYVVSGGQGPDGTDLPRFAAMLQAVLVDSPTGWEVASLSFSSLAE